MMDYVISKINLLREYLNDAFNGDENRFRTAQVLYIISVCCACYLDDTIRRLFFIAALLIINKKQRCAAVIKNWRGLAKAAGFCFLVFGLWIMAVPLIFGDESLWERIRGVPRPLEIAIWIWGGWVFAKDSFFYKKMLLISSCSFAFGATAFFIQRACQHFAAVYQGWLFQTDAIECGVTLLCLFPWAFYHFLHLKDNKINLLYALVFVEYFVVLISTYYSTIYVSFFIQTAVLIFLCAINNKLRPNARTCLNLAIIIVMAAGMVACTVHKQPAVKARLEKEVDQLTSFNTKDLESFTTERMDVWHEAVSCIKQRPLAGYGWADYDNYVSIKKSHPHSSYLEVAFHTGIPGAVIFAALLLLLSVLCAKKIVVVRADDAVAFSVLLMLVAYAVVGLTESFFLVRREFAMIFWAPVSLLLAGKGWYSSGDGQ